MVIEQVERIGEWVTLKEAARMLGCSHNAVDLAVRLKSIPHIKVGRSILVRQADIEVRYRPRSK